MTEQPLVSVVVPVYNTEKYISDCLESLLAQTEKNIEILVVDDGSSDDSPAILRRYAANYPQIRIFTQKNAGPGAARNTALKHARGKYVMFCDSDDMFKPSMCREMAQTMEKENVDFAFCDVEEHNNKNQKIRVEKSEFISIKPNNIPDISFSIWCFIFRRELLEKYKINFPSCFYGEDFAFLMEYIFISHFAYAIPQKLYIQQARNDSLMHSLSKKTYDPKIIYNLNSITEMYNFLQRNKLWTDYKRSCLKLAERLAIFCFQYIADQDKKKSFQYLQDILRPMKDDVADFKILFLAVNDREKDFYKCLSESKLNGTRRIKLYGIPLLKIKNKLHEQIYYFAGIPLLKSVHDGKGCRRYVLGIRIF